MLLKTFFESFIIQKVGQFPDISVGSISSFSYTEFLIHIWNVIYVQCEYIEEVFDMKKFYFEKLRFILQNNVAVNYDIYPDYALEFIQWKKRYNSI